MYAHESQSRGAQARLSNCGNVLWVKKLWSISSFGHLPPMGPDRPAAVLPRGICLDTPPHPAGTGGQSKSLCQQVVCWIADQVLDMLASCFMSIISTTILDEYHLLPYHSDLASTAIAGCLCQGEMSLWRLRYISRWNPAA